MTRRRAIELIARAIREHRRVEIVYRGLPRVVEPHQLAFNPRNEVALSGYHLGGHSNSDGGRPGWRSYLLAEIELVKVLASRFRRPRPGYKRTPNENFHDAISEL